MSSCRRGDNLRYKFIPIRVNLGLVKLWRKAGFFALAANSSCLLLGCRLLALTTAAGRPRVVFTHFAVSLFGLQVAKDSPAFYYRVSTRCGATAPVTALRV